MIKQWLTIVIKNRRDRAGDVGKKTGPLEGNPVETKYRNEPLSKIEETRLEVVVKPKTYGAAEMFTPDNPVIGFVIAALCFFVFCVFI